MSAKNQIFELLCQGVSPAQSAAALGVSESYVSQLLADPDFSLAVSEQRAKLSENDLDFDKKLQDVELLYLERIEQKAPTANLQQSIQAFKVINSARKRKDIAAPSSQSATGVVVNITLPTVAIPQFITNAKNEIVEVEGQTMISATPSKLDEILQAKTPTKEDRALERLESLQSKPVRRTLKNLSTDELSDLL